MFPAANFTCRCLELAPIGCPLTDSAYSIACPLTSGADECDTTKLIVKTDRAGGGWGCEQAAHPALLKLEQLQHINEKQEHHIMTGILIVLLCVSLGKSSRARRALCCTVRKGGYRILLISPATSDSDIQESQELDYVRRDAWSGTQDVYIVGE
eukprot:498257-Prorocentrum_minimum.AAC.2